MKPHDCRQEERLARLETQQDELKKEINKKLDKIWAAMKSGDSENTKYIFMVVGMFLGAFISGIAILIYVR